MQCAATEAAARHMFNFKTHPGYLLYSLRFSAVIWGLLIVVVIESHGL